MTRRERLRARQLPTATVELAPVGGGDPERIELRALPADEFEALMREHPPTAEQAETGASWNEHTFWPALLSACEVPLEGEERLSPEDWREMRLPLGERVHLFDTAVALNDRSPVAAVGKG